MAGWFSTPDQKLGSPKGLILLMAMVQQRKLNVQPVMDYHGLNQYNEAYMINVCASNW